MRNFIYKTIIACIAFFILFEFTVGRKLQKLDQVLHDFLTKEGRKEVVKSIKIEMEKATKSENYLTKDERILINNFISKIKGELNSAKAN